MAGITSQMEDDEENYRPNVSKSKSFEHREMKVEVNRNQK